ncbi:unnamed protein product [Adineta ricciae]|uniref:Uroporphyrinogen-III synthase n=1 Tax=Adineta ricciae TaxID=249248 RepID=A0A816FII1_ADIRI|nr:unnamed protein product [Adineta ricciae]CAF1661972.1 unnamed protein product [Adineta ricciae]
MPVKTIVLFRSKADDAINEDIYEKLLTEHDYAVKTLSPIQFHFINQDLLSTKLQSGDYHSLIFTSKRAVEAVQQVLTDHNRKRFQRIYVEGPATASLVKDLFGSTVDILGAESGGGESLAEFIIKDVQNRKETANLLFPCAQARLDILPKRLSNAPGIHFDEITVYETIPSDSLDRELQEYLTNHGRPDVFGFFSPSGFESVHKSCQRIGFDLCDNKSVLISLGKTTSAAIRHSLGSKSFDERSCSKPIPEEFLRVVETIE